MVLYPQGAQNLGKQDSPVGLLGRFLRPALSEPWAPQGEAGCFCPQGAHRLTMENKPVKHLNTHSKAFLDILYKNGTLPLPLFGFFFFLYSLSLDLTRYTFTRGISFLLLYNKLLQTR